MKYVFLTYKDEQHWGALSADERKALENTCLANDEVLRDSGHLFAIEHLHGNNSATTVRVRDGKTSLANGPVAGTYVQLTGLFFIIARDLNEAIHLASHMPQARGGPVEVRPIVEFDQQQFSNPVDDLAKAANKQVKLMNLQVNQ